MFKWQTSEWSLTRLVDYREIRGIVQHDAVIHPNEAVVIIDDGKVSEILTQTRLARVGGGFANAVNRWFNTGRDVEFLFLDTTEKVLRFPGGQSEPTITLRNREHDEVAVAAHMVFQADGRRVSLLYGLTKQQPTKELSIVEVRNRVWEELLARVLGNRIRQYSSSELGDISIINDIEASVRAELAKTLEGWGLNLLRFTSRFGPTAWEEMHKHARELELKAERTIREKGAEEAVDERGHAIDMRADERGFERGLQKVKLDTTILREQAQADIGLRDVQRTADSRDAIERTTTTQKVRDLELEQQKKRTAMAIEMKDKYNEVETKRLEREAKIKAEYIQQTEIRAREVDADVAKHAATMEAEKAKYGMETYDRALDRADQRTTVVLDMFQKTVESSKPNVPQTYVGGGDGAARTQVDLIAGTGTPVLPTAAGARRLVPCPACGAENLEGARFCSGCGQKMV